MPLYYGILPAVYIKNIRYVQGPVMMKHILVLDAHRLHITAFVRKKALKKKFVSKYPSMRLILDVIRLA